MLGPWISEYEAESTLPGESSLAEGESEATKDMAQFVARYPQWMTNFGVKLLVEQAMIVSEQEVVVFALVGADPASDDFQYWQGYEDAIQRTIDAMNAWPDTGGAVPGTSREYELSAGADNRSASEINREPRGERN
jgi:hypothetical protein